MVKPNIYADHRYVPSGSTFYCVCGWPDYAQLSTSELIATDWWNMLVYYNYYPGALSMKHIRPWNTLRFQLQMPLSAGLTPRQYTEIGSEVGFEDHMI